MRVAPHEVHAALCDPATAWVIPLAQCLPPPPQDLVDFSKRSPSDRTFAEEHYIDALVQPLRRHRRVISGGRCLRLRSFHMERFVKGLFHHIAEHSPVKVTLCPFDLSHGHMVACPDAAGGVVDFAIVFHAKEYPKEYRHSTHGGVLPIGHPDMGGDEDPRIGTSYSTDDADYHMRNYVYLLSRNEVVLIDGGKRRDGGLLGAVITPDEFATFNEWKLGTIVGDVNYFVEEGVLVSPRHGWEVGVLLNHAMHGLREAVAATPPHALSTVAAQDAPLVAALQKDLMPPQTCVHTALDNVKTVLRRASVAELEGLRAIGSLHHMPSGCTEVLAAWAATEVKHKEEEKKRGNEKHVQELVNKGVSPQHADVALRHTAAEGVYSAYRAAHLLEVAYPQYRSPTNTQVFGAKQFSFETAKCAWSHAFYADSALEALDLTETHAIDLREACARVVERRDAQTREQLLQRQPQCPRARDNKARVLRELRERGRPHL
eukprot:TRINITY_DN30326_c0_g1_i1.p1 TRINITY_DN30326_c0_g1~~TRINITY_DN30326_c0_g1_i1.p1  ORF type:complete len:489 (+),score=103.16 TRINITY_DN30326_c0_g1_i1:84-1550(+)